MAEHYSADGFDPPAPIAKSIVCNPATGTTMQCADAPRYKIEAFDGRTSQATLAYCQILFSRFRFAGDYVVYDGQHGIIGRNILNQLKCVLDGPNETWELLV